MNTLLKRYMLITVIPLTLIFTNASCGRIVTSYVISQVVVIGQRIGKSMLVRYMANQIDRGLKYIFSIIAQDSTPALVSANDITPIDGTGQLGRKRGDPKFKIQGQYADGEIINHIITVPTEKVLFQRANMFSQWKLTPDSKDEIAKRLLVASVQVALRKYGYSPGRVDGIDGINTGKAVRAFQQDAGLPMTGDIDDATSHKLLKK